MKRFLKFSLPIVAVLVVAGIFFGAGSIKNVPMRSGYTIDSYTTTYVASQVDTITWNYEAGVSALSFAAHWNDSVAITSASVRRVFNGALAAAIASDSLSGWSMIALTDNGADTPNTLTNGNSRIGAITLAPLAEQYVVILTYTSSGQGTTSTVTRTPTATYGFIKSKAR